MRKPDHGFSLIELMIAVTLGMLAVAAVGSVFIYGSRNYKQDDKVSRMQDELRFAMAQLSQDLEMAGFWAQLRDPLNEVGVDASATITTDCGPTTDGGAATAANNWVFNERRAGIATLGDVTGANAAATFPCISSTEIVEGTDIIAIKRLGSMPVVPGGGDVGKPMFRTNGVASTLYKHSDPPPAPAGTACQPVPNPAAGCVTVYDYRPAVWYIRKWVVNSSGPQLPSLCRKRLTDVAGDLIMQNECLAQGIADMQLEFGFDNNVDGVADYFVEFAAAQDPAAVLARVVAVRVHLLGRSGEADVGYVNSKTYELASLTRGPFNDGYYRRALSSTVLLRNQVNRLIPYSLPSS